MSHNHPPTCCCDIPPGDMPTEDADPTYLCPECPDHGAFAGASQQGVKHEPFPDDGVTYCGWHAGNGRVIDGCGEVWPCSTARSEYDRYMSAPEGER